MNLKKKSNAVSSGRSLLPLISLLLFVVSCNTFRTKDYFHPKFECNASLGWQNPKDFQRYISDVWWPVRLIYQDDNRKIKQSKAVIVGNSLVHLFLPEQMKTEFPGIQIVNRGIGGDMTETLLERIDEDVLTLNPATIIIEIGGNDLLGGKCLSSIQRNIESLVEKIRKKNDGIKILFLAAPPTKVSDLNKIVPVYNLFLSEFARKQKNVTYIEVWDEMRKIDEPTLREEFHRPGGDPIHFNEKGYEVWSKKLRPYL